MKSRKGNREVALVASGIILGTAITAPTVGAALTAQPSSQKIVVDGKPVQIEAYSIGGSNYCKLRDVGRAVGFAVDYDPMTNTVNIRTGEPYAEETQAPSPRTVTLSTDGSQYVPRVRDVILCDDGTEYEIKDVARWNSSPLPTPTCDWDAFPALALPESIVKHYCDQYGDDLFVRNVYEVCRMVYTLYNALGDEPEAWRDGKPLFRISTEIPAEYEPYTERFWPWRESEITSTVHACPNMRYYVDAYAVYHNGVYLCTRYCFMSI